MAFENVNTELLKNSINSCISSIDYSSSSQIITDITNNSVWSTSSRDNFKKAMEKLIDVRYKALENKLNDYLELINQIEKYKSISDSTASMQLELSILNDELSTINQTSDSQQISALENDTKVSDITSKINSLNENISNNENTLASLKSSIELLL